MFKKIIQIALLAAGVFLISWTAVNRRELKDFPGIISAFYSKEMCSCVFVVGQTEEFCTNYARQWIPIRGVPQVDREKKSIRVTGLFRTNEAIYAGERKGCVLRPAE